MSDRFGRRPVILISCFGLGLDYIVMALAPTIGWLLFGRILSGICASSFTTAGAYIADVAPPEKRAAAFGLLGAAFGVGFVLRVAPQEQGKLQGANGSITSIAGLIGPVLFTVSFAHFIDRGRTWTLPGAPFLIAAALLVLALLLALRAARPARMAASPAA